MNCPDFDGMDKKFEHNDDDYYLLFIYTGINFINIYLKR